MVPQGCGVLTCGEQDDPVGVLGTCVGDGEPGPFGGGGPGRVAVEAHSERPGAAARDGGDVVGGQRGPADRKRCEREVLALGEEFQGPDVEDAFDQDGSQPQRSSRPDSVGPRNPLRTGGGQARAWMACRYRRPAR